jgi:plastocyanin
LKEFMPKTSLLMIVLGIVVVGVIVYFASSSSGSSESKQNPKTASAEDAVVTVKITEDGFDPSEVKINKGETVAWVNETSGEHWPASNLHPTHEIYPQFDPREPILPGQTWAFKFEKVGKWNYHDHLAPNQRGSVEVENN